MVLISPKAFPIADKVFSMQIFDLIELAVEFKQIKRGANESTKVLKRGLVEIIIIAADAEPLEIVLHLPLLCEDKNVPYIFVSSKQNLGKACGVLRSVIACCITTKYDSSISRQIKTVKEKIENLLI
jgi:ribosomal protein L7Ae-like RNA K-turn-binding protein